MNTSKLVFVNNEYYDCLKTDHDACLMTNTIEDAGFVLSDDTRRIVEFVDYVFICAFVGLFGMIANVINIIIFYKQGFINTVNIAFLGLAVSDLCCLAGLVWESICMNPCLPVYDITWVSIEVMYLSAAWPHVCFCRITSYITVYITAERFISIAWPLKVKQIITATRTTAIICLIYIINMVTVIPEYATSYLGWTFVPRLNKTLIGIIFTENIEEVQGVCFVVHALLSATSFLGVVMCTCALVLKLRQTSQWRQDVAASQLKGEHSSNKERRTVKMVVLIASVLIICYTPGAIISMTMFIIGPEFNIRGRHVNICAAVWSVAHACQSINSSVNIFLYYTMSSKFRQTFDEISRKLFQRCMYTN